MTQTRRGRRYETVTATIHVPLEIEVECDVTNPERVGIVSADLTGALSDDRLLRLVREQGATVIAELERRKAGNL